MSTSFSRTMRSLGARPPLGSTVRLLAIAAGLCAWGAWLFLSQVPLYEVTESARLEISPATYPLQALAAGRVVETRLELGRMLSEGEVVVELDSRELQLRAQEERARLAALSAQLEAARQELAAEERRLRLSREASRESQKQAEARRQEALAAARFAREQVARLEQLQAEGLASREELERERALAEQKRSAAEALAFAHGRLGWEGRAGESERQARIARLRRDISQLEGDLATGQVTVSRLEDGIRKRSVRAPAAGRLGEAQRLQVGAFVQEGQQLGAVVPPGQLTVIARFPAESLGRIRPGQEARIRLEGFPWTQYGLLHARVLRVASETRDGLLQVELGLSGDLAPAVPHEHGLPGQVEVEVERLSPAALLVRSVWKRLEAVEHGAPARPAQEAA